MKIALCLSGHARTYKHTHQFWEKNLFSKHDVDVYMHLWETVGPRYFGEDVNRNEHYPIPRPDNHSGILPSVRVDSTNVTDIWNPVEISIERYDDAHGKFLSNIVPIIEERNRRGYPEGFEHHHPLSVRSMLYKRFRCDELRQESGKNYDFVIQSRPDVVLTKPLEFERFAGKLMFHNCRSNIPNELADFGIVGNSLHMKLWTDLYNKIDWLFQSMKAGEDFLQFLNPHKLYVHYLTQMSVPFEEADIGFSILRDTGIILGHEHDKQIIRKELNIQ